MQCRERISVHLVVIWSDWDRYAKMVCVCVMMSVLRGVYGCAGKTYTLLGALQYISTRLHHRKVDITFYEIRGKKGYDLLNGHGVVTFLEDENREVHVRGCRHVTMENMDPAAFLQLMSDALSLRTSKATERNPLSSRSHAVCTLCVYDMEETGEGSDVHWDMESSVDTTTTTSTTKKKCCAKLRLVDLAGSERNFETLSMTAADHRESADINFTLMALKDCFRAYNYERSGKVPVGSLTGHAAGSQHGLEKGLTKEEGAAHVDHAHQKQGTTTRVAPVYYAKSATAKKPKNVISTGSRFTKAPYRATLLTRLLRECFLVGSSHKTSIIATVSPTPTDIEHTINTLEHVTMMDSYVQLMSNSHTVDILINGAALLMTPVEQWTHSQLCVWLAYVEGGRFSQLVLPSGIDGAALLGMTVTSLSALSSGELRQARQGEEGAAWVEEVDDNRRQNFIGKALWAALRREQHASALRSILAAKQPSDDDMLG